MRKVLRFIYYKIFYKFLWFMVHRAYKEYPNNVTPERLLQYALFQRLLLINNQIRWPVHWSSHVDSKGTIERGENSFPGYAPCQYIQCVNGIKIGKNCTFGKGTNLISGDHHYNPEIFRTYEPDRPIEIADNVWIGVNVTILPGVHIGTNVMVGAGSVVTHDIPANSIVGGNPCRIIREKEPLE